MSMTIDLDDIPGPKGRPSSATSGHRRREPDRDVSRHGPRLRPHLQDLGPDRNAYLRLRARPRRGGLRRRPIRQDGRGRLANLRRGPTGNGLFTSDTDDPLAARAQHPDGTVQRPGHARLHATDAGHRGPAHGQVGAAEPRRRGRRPGGHDAADPGHHRPLRVRLPLQLVLPRDAAPVRRGHGAHPGGVAEPHAAAADPDPTESGRSARARRTTPS